MRDGHRPREVGREHERPLEDGDQQEVAGRVVARDLRAELADARGQLLPGEVDGARAGLYVTRFRPYF
jgi:hypothetical protein